MKKALQLLIIYLLAPSLLLGAACCGAWIFLTEIRHVGWCVRSCWQCLRYHHREVLHPGIHRRELMDGKMPVPFTTHPLPQPESN